MGDFDFDLTALPKWQVKIQNMRNGALHTSIIESAGGEDAANKFIATFKIPDDYAIVSYKKVE